MIYPLEQMRLENRILPNNIISYYFLPKITTHNPTINKATPKIIKLDCSRELVNIINVPVKPKIAVKIPGNRLSNILKKNFAILNMKIIEKIIERMDTHACICESPNWEIEFNKNPPNPKLPSSVVMSDKETEIPLRTEKMKILANPMCFLSKFPFLA